MNQIKKVSKKIILAYCIPQFAVGLFTAMISNYLLYFYQPSKESGIPTLITQGVVVLGILTFIGFVKAVGHIIDAVTDPLVANLSDKSRNKKGRRIPFMKYAAIPFGLSALLIFCAPQNTPGLVNNIWVAVFIWAYFVFYTLYMIPHNALLPEMITDTKERVNVYTFNSLFFVTGSALGYVTPALVGMFKNAGLDVLLAWRATFAIFTVVGIILLLIPAVMIKEREYVNSVRPTVSLMQSLKHAFSNKHFRWVTLGQLLEGTAMSFFQSCIMYYVTSLMGLPETASVAILAISIVGSRLALFVSFPFAVLNILPGSMMADVIQYDTLITGINQEGIFSAARSFITKLGTSLAIMIVPSLTVIGAAAGENIGRTGLKVTALVGGLFCLGAVIAFIKYREDEVLGLIRQKGEKQEKEAVRK